MEDSPGLSDPRPFFDALLEKPYRSRTILSPHVYPPSVTYDAGPRQYGEGLWNRLNLSFGSKTQKGYCTSEGKDCQTFPVAIGEFGSKFESSVDNQALKDFASYLNNEGPAANSEHNPIRDWFYWCVNLCAHQRFATQVFFED